MTPNKYFSLPFKYIGAFFFTFFMMSAPSMVVATELIRGDKPIARFMGEPIYPLPMKVDRDPRIVELGRKLFIDPRLSADDTISCNTCHPLNRYGVDGLKFSFGINGLKGTINTPTVYNSGMSFFQFWDGRALNLEEQVSFPIHAANEMGSNWDQIINKLQADKDYRKSFAEVYSEGITAETITSAIATFERTLVTPNSRFDQFLRGDENAITQNELQGYILFKNYGCSSCHQGSAVGANMFERMGVIDDYFKKRGNITEADFGRFNVTGHELDRFEFKVPSLRNVAETAPYFHDGTAETLEQAVQTMAKHQLGRIIKPDDLKHIVGFLHTLTGEIEQ